MRPGSESDSTKSPRRSEESAPLARPDVYSYHDYRAFLSDCIAYLKQTAKPFSLRKLAQAVGISPSLFSMVLSGSRSFSEEQLNRLMEHLRLDSSEQSYLQWLRSAAEASTPEEKLEVLGKIQRFRQYRNLNPLEFETYHYLTNWYYIAIRELATLPEFQATPEWIQKHLKYSVRQRDIEKALKFLMDYGFLQTSSSGTMQKPEKRLVCDSNVLRPVMAGFHKQMLDLAGQSIERTPSQQRNLTSHTCAISEDQFEQAKAILQDALDRIADLSKETDQKKQVYHFGLLAFPLTEKPEEDVGE